MPRLFRSGLPKPPKSWERMDEYHQCHHSETSDYSRNQPVSSGRRYEARSSQDASSTSALEESLKWDNSSMASSSPTNITDYDDFFSNKVIDENGFSLSVFRGEESNQSEGDSELFTKRHEPPVSHLKLMRTLSNIFSAFWEQADLYTDVLGLENDQPTPRQLRLCFFRRGRTILSTPIESVDDMTMLSLGIKCEDNSTTGFDSSSINVIQSGVTVSRKGKLKFQAISLAYEILNDETKKKQYHEWKLWNPRLPPPSFEEEHASIQIDQSTVLSSTSKESFSNKEPTENRDREIDVESRTSICRSMHSNIGSILQPSRYGNNKLNRLASNRKITWNEEVEELVILEDNYKDDNYSMESIDRIEYCNDPGLQDIGHLRLNHDDDSLSTIVDAPVVTVRDDDQSWLAVSLNGSQGHDHNSIHTENSGDTSISESNFTINSSNFLSKESKRRFNSKVLSTVKNDSETKQFIGLDWLVPPSQTNRKSIHSSESVHSWITEQSTTIEGGKDASSNFRIKIKAPPKDTAANRSNAAVRRKYRKSISAAQDCDSGFKIGPDCVTSNPVGDDCSENLAAGAECNPFRFRRTSRTSTTTDGKVDRNNNNKNSCGHGDDEFGTKSDFPVHLTNYVTEAVAEMKQGLSKLGKKWNELDFNKIGANNFFLRDSELDALMGILDKETGSSPTNPCTMNA